MTPIFISRDCLNALNNASSKNPEYFLREILSHTRNPTVQEMMDLCPRLDTREKREFGFEEITSVSHDDLLRFEFLFSGRRAISYDNTSQISTAEIVSSAISNASSLFVSQWSGGLCKEKISNHLLRFAPGFIAGPTLSHRDLISTFRLAFHEKAECEECFAGILRWFAVFITKSLCAFSVLFLRDDECISYPSLAKVSGFSIGGNEGILLVERADKILDGMSIQVVQRNSTTAGAVEGFQLFLRAEIDRFARHAIGQTLKCHTIDIGNIIQCKSCTKFSLQ